MKIMTFNTQHCQSYIEKTVDYGIMARTISDLGADIVGLNEMFNGGKYDEQTKVLAEKAGMEYYYFAKAIDDSDGPYGNGILSRYKITSVEAIKIPDPLPRECQNGYYETRVLLKARLENGLTVLITHFGLNPDEQKSAVKTVLENLTEEKCILMGDFNVTPENEVLKPIREKMKDAGALFENKLLSFPSDKPRIKIDYIFTSLDIEIISADIPKIIASDHLPHIAEIKL